MEQGFIDGEVWENSAHGLATMSLEIKINRIPVEKQGKTILMDISRILEF